MNGPPYLLRAELDLPRRREDVFAFFSAAENLGRITPPELAFKILTPLPVAMKPGTLIEYSIGLWLIPLRWRTKITLWRPPAAFIDEQLKGPYAQWVHTHTFTEIPGGTRIVDEVRYRLPFGLLGRLVHPIVRMQLRRIFAFRQRRVRELLAPASKIPGRTRRSGGGRWRGSSSRRSAASTGATRRSPKARSPN